MKLEVEMEEILERSWDLHDKFSDTIHTISRTHFLNLKNKHNKGYFFDNNKSININNNGFVFSKNFDKESSFADAKTLNSIRSALELVEQQLTIFHTVETQQHAERNSALARLEQSRIGLALRLAEHQGKKYKVIDEAMDFVGNVKDATSCFMGPENFSDSPASAPLEHSTLQKGVNSNVFVRVLFSGLGSAKRTLQLDKLGGVLGNAALFAISMLAIIHLQQVTYKDNGILHIGLKQDRMFKKLSQDNGSSSISPLDVRLARG